MKKKLLIAAAALLFAVTMSAQPGGMGGFGGPMGGPGMGGPGMGGPMGGPGMGMTDPFASVRTDIAYDRADELKELLGLNDKVAKKVFKIYNHIDGFIMEEMSKRFQGNGEGGQRGGGNGAPQGGFPGMGGMRPGGMGGFPGMGNGFPGMGEGEVEITNIPISKKERAWREKQMEKILTPEQYEKWLAYEDEKAAQMPSFGAPGAGFPGGAPQGGFPGGPRQ